MLYKNLLARNSTEDFSNIEERIFLPFIIIHTKKQTVIELEMSDDKTEYFFDFTLPFSIHDDNEVLKKMEIDKLNFTDATSIINTANPGNIDNSMMENDRQKFMGGTASAGQSIDATTPPNFLE